ncbi:MAG: 16S rRNA 2'-O-ribose methyltransferase [Candidatus Westeberhardia cardiocondylae]|nr:16S rRNA 2'-O-ribose methyltransferase [Candidatus Westeberhardia cardiocondylae]
MKKTIKIPLISQSKLYVVATPIGNMQDITKRALHILKNANLIAAENIKHTNILLKNFSIKNKKILILHNHNEKTQTKILLKKLSDGKSIALVSNAGTPLINDPGYLLVKQCHKNKIPVIPVPGACAAISALSVSGLKTNKFCYEGFLPKKQQLRLKYLKKLKEESRTIIFYESCHRLLNTIKDILLIFGTKRKITLAKELTKKWEKIYKEPSKMILHRIKNDKNLQKGEIVLLIEGNNSIQKNNNIIKAIQTIYILKQEISLKQSTKLVEKIFNIKKNILYKEFIKSQKKSIKQNKKLYNIIKRVS